MNNNNLTTRAAVKQMKDNRIISLCDENEYLIIADVEQQDKEYFFKALVVEDHLSQKIKNIIREYWECVNLFSITILDDLEDILNGYNFMLQKPGIKIFNIELKGDYVTYFVKYPTAKGYMDDYPHSELMKVAERGGA